MKTHLSLSIITHSLLVLFKMGLLFSVVTQILLVTTFSFHNNTYVGWTNYPTMNFAKKIVFKILFQQPLYSGQTKHNNAHAIE